MVTKEIEDLGELIAKAQEHADNMMRNLSSEDRQKVNNIVNSVDVNNQEEMETYLKNQKNAS